MDNFFQEFDIRQCLYVSWIIVDNILFTLYMVTIGYLAVFAVGSTLKKKDTYPRSKKNYRYAVIFYVGNKQLTILESLSSFAKQSYLGYEVVVLTHSTYTDLNQVLSEMPVKLIISQIDNYNKVDAIRYAISDLSDPYDVAVIMDADSEVDENFLEEINNAYYSGGMAIQTHSVAKHLESNTAIFVAASEEINNSIFRLGHVNMRLSSALIGSGMAFNFEWLKKNIVDLTSNDLEKQLETKLLEQSVFIEYLNDVYVYGTKASKAEEFYQERSTWLTNGKQGFKIILHKLPRAFSQGNYDYCDKLIQWLLPSRMLIAGTLLFIAVFVLILSWAISIKWWFLLFILIVTFSIALPDYLIDTRFVKALRGAPLLFLLTVFNTLKRKISPVK